LQALNGPQLTTVARRTVAGAQLGVRNAEAMRAGSSNAATSMAAWRAAEAAFRDDIASCEALKARGAAFSSNEAELNEARAGKGNSQAHMHKPGSGTEPAR